MTVVDLDGASFGHEYSDTFKILATFAPEERHGIEGWGLGGSLHLVLVSKANVNDVLGGLPR